MACSHGPEILWLFHAWTRQRCLGPAIDPAGWQKARRSRKASPAVDPAPRSSSMKLRIERRCRWPVYISPRGFEGQRAFPITSAARGMSAVDHEVACANAPHDLAVRNIQFRADLDGVDAA